MHQFKEINSGFFPEAAVWHLFVFLTPAEDQVVVSSDYDSTHEANHSDSSDVAHTEDDAEEGKNSQNVILHALIPPEVRRAKAAVSVTLVLLIKQEHLLLM